MVEGFRHARQDCLYPSLVPDRVSRASLLKSCTTTKLTEAALRTRIPEIGHVDISPTHVCTKKQRYTSEPSSLYTRAETL